MTLTEHYIKYNNLLRKDFYPKIEKYYAIYSTKVVFNGNNITSAYNNLFYFASRNPEYSLDYDAGTDEFTVKYEYSDGDRDCFNLPREFFDDFDNFLENYKVKVAEINQKEYQKYEKYIEQKNKELEQKQYNQYLELKKLYEEKPEWAILHLYLHRIK